MEDDFQHNLKTIILSLLEKESQMLTSHLVEEIRLEYPSTWKKLQVESQKNFPRGCGQVWWPSTRVIHLLFELEKEGLVKKASGKEYLWSLHRHGCRKN